MKQRLSLKGRAIALLAQREQSAVELRRKLMRHARDEAAAMAREFSATSRRSADASLGDGPAAPSAAVSSSLSAALSAAVLAVASAAGSTTVSAGESDATDVSSVDSAEPSIAERVDAVIAWLMEHDYLSEARFVESRVHARSARFGTSRIQRELSEHGVSLSGEVTKVLRASEPDRAAELWQRKFGRSPVDRAEQGRQMRFLIARGFAPDVVRRLVQLAPSGSRHFAPDPTQASESD